MYIGRHRYIHMHIVFHIYVGHLESAGNMAALSLSTVVLNSRDWSEIIWLPEISCFKINLAIALSKKTPLECIG